MPPPPPSYKMKMHAFDMHTPAEQKFGGKGVGGQMTQWKNAAPDGPFHLYCFIVDYPSLHRHKKRYALPWITPVSEGAFFVQQASDEHSSVVPLPCPANGRGGHTSELRCACRCEFAFRFSSFPPFFFGGGALS